MYIFSNRLHISPVLQTDDMLMILKNQLPKEYSEPVGAHVDSLFGLTLCILRCEARRGFDHLRSKCDPWSSYRVNAYSVRRFMWAISIPRT